MPCQILASFLERCPAEHVEEMRFPCEPREYFAARCLRARKFALADALKLVEITTAWRKEMNIKGLLARDSADILGCLEDELQFFYQKSYFACRDNEGRPVYVERGGTVDVEAMFRAFEGPRGGWCFAQARTHGGPWPWARRARCPAAPAPP